MVNQRKSGVLLSYISQAVHIVVNLLYTPIMLRLLGQSEYGLYQLVYSVVSYLGLLSMGFGNSYLRYYSRYKEKNDDYGVARLNGMFMTIFLTIALICVICGGIMVGNIRQIFESGLTDEEYVIASILMKLLVLNMAITFPNSVFNCYITSQEEFVFQKVIILLQNIMSPFLTLPLLIMGVGSIGMVSVTTTLTILTLISNIVFCFKKLHIKFVFENFDFRLLKEMWIFTFFIFLNQIIDKINWSVDKFLLGRLMGTTAVAVYGVGGQINTMYLQFSTSISNVFVPKVNRIAAGKDDNTELTMLFTKVGRIQFIVLGLILSGFIFLGRPFINLWAGEEYEISYYVALLLIIPVTVPLIQNLGIEIQTAKNMHKARSIVYSFISIVNILISIPLIKKYGSVGAAFGTLIALVVGNIVFMNWYYHKRIGLDMVYFWKEIIKFIPALIIPCIVGVVIVQIIRISNLFKLIITIMIYSVVYCFSMYFLGMNDTEKNIVTKPIKKFFSSKYSIL